MNKKAEVKAQYIFYSIGIAFLFATVAYFSYEYIFELSNVAKAIILIFITFIFFLIADVMAWRDV